MFVILEKRRADDLQKIGPDHCLLFPRLIIKRPRLSDLTVISYATLICILICATADTRSLPLCEYSLSAVEIIQA